MGEECRRSSIPVIDLKEIPFQHAKLREVCEEWGCFRVLNHGVPVELMSEMKKLSRTLLDLPIEVKKKYDSILEPGIGYLRDDKPTNIYESLGLYDLKTTNSLELFCSQLDLTSEQRKTVEAYTSTINALALEVGDKIAQSMGLEGSGFFEGWHCQFRLNKYSFAPETVGSSGLLTHTDTGLLSILQDDEVVGGLEVADGSGSFVPVESYPGTFVVNLGDMAVVWSNGKLRSVKHHVQCKEIGVRISIGGFVVPPKDLATIEASEELVDRHPPRLYNPFSFEDYKQLRKSKKMPNDGALSFLLAQT